MDPYAQSLPSIGKSPTDAVRGPLPLRRSEKTQIPFLNSFRIKFHVSIYGNPGYVFKNHFYEGLGLRF